MGGGGRNGKFTREVSQGTHWLIATLKMSGNRQSMELGNYTIQW